MHLKMQLTARTLKFPEWQQMRLQQTCGQNLFTVAAGDVSLCCVASSISHQPAAFVKLMNINEIY